MRYAIVSDIHANTEALDRVLSDAREQGVDQIVCLGDIVGYGPRPAEALARVRETCVITLAGNHDDAVSGRGAADAFIGLAGDAVVRHRDTLSPADLAWLRALPWSCELEGAIAAHGDMCESQKFYYIENEEDACANFNATDAQLLFVGHTHVPTIFLTGQSGAVYRIEPQDFTLENGKRYIVNPGSVGYPREKDGRCLSSYVIYDSIERTVCFRFLPFSVASVMQRGKSPRRIRKRLLVVGALVIGLVCAGLAWFLAPKTEGFDEHALFVDRREISIPAGCRGIRANVELADGSAEARLRVITFDATGLALATNTHTFKTVMRRKIEFSKKTVRAELSLFKLEPEATVKIKGFAPTVLMKPDKGDK